MGPQPHQPETISRTGRRFLDGPVVGRVSGRLVMVLITSFYSTGYAISAGAETANAEVARVLHWNPFEKPAPAAAQAVSPQQPVQKAAPWEPALRATLVGGARPRANVDGRLMVLGDEVEGYKLVGVQERRAVFEKEGVRRILTMDSKHPIK